MSNYLGCDPDTISGSEEFDIQLIISLIKGGDAKKALEYCEKLNPALVYKYNFVRILLNANPDYLDSALDVALQDIRYCEENIR